MESALEVSRDTFALELEPSTCPSHQNHLCPHRPLRCLLRPSSSVDGLLQLTGSGFCNRSRTQNFFSTSRSSPAPPHCYCTLMSPCKANNMPVLTCLQASPALPDAVTQCPWKTKALLCPLTRCWNELLLTVPCISPLLPCCLRT